MSNDEVDKSLYRAENTFLMRTPLLPIEAYVRMDNHSCSGTEMLTKLFEYKGFKEAILISSPSLYSSLETIGFHQDERKNNQVLNALLKYWIRATTRTTPFGLFAGVSVADFSKKSNRVVNVGALKKVRVDVRWLCSLCRVLEEKAEDFLMQINPCCLIKGNRAYLPLITNYGRSVKTEKDSTFATSIIYSKNVEHALTRARSPIKYQDLARFFIGENPSVSEKEIYLFIDQLVENEFLISEFRPPLDTSDPFAYVLDLLKDRSAFIGMYFELLAIKESIETYSCIPIGEGEEHFLRTVAAMEKLARSDSNAYLHVDMVTKVEAANLSLVVKDEVEKVVAMMWQLSPKSKNSGIWTEYTEAFIEKYGVYRLINVKELIDDDLGLGAPASYRMPYSKRKERYLDCTDRERQLEKLVLDKVMQALKLNDDEVVITECDIQSFNEDEELLPPPYSIELYFSVSSNLSDKEDSLLLYLPPLVGTHSFGKNAGRFLDILPESFQSDFTNTIEKEKKYLGESTLLLEMNEFPRITKLANLTNKHTTAGFSIDISTRSFSKEKKIDLSDIYVGLEKSLNTYAFYLYSKKYAKKLKIRMNNMFNLKYCSNVGRFLCEVSEGSECTFLYAFNLVVDRALSKCCYTPRIKYSSTIIRPATWRLDKQSLNFGNEEITKKLFIEKLRCWRNTWHVPQYIYVQQNDQRLLLNLNNTAHLEILYTDFKTHCYSTLSITEVEEGVLQQISSAKTSSFSYVHEFVVPLVLTDRYKKRTRFTKASDISLDKIHLSSQATTHLIEHTFYPGDSWISLKIYGITLVTEEFVCSELVELIDKLPCNTEVIWYYLRYADPEEHLRVRIYIPNDSERSTFFLVLSNWFNKLSGRGIIRHSVIDTYTREVERYGGPRVMPAVERLFFQDSTFSIALLRLADTEKVSIELLAIAGIINMLEELGLCYLEQKSWLESIVEKKQNRFFFNQNRKLLVEICNSNDDWKGLRQQHFGEKLFKLFRERQKSLNAFSLSLKQLENSGELWNDRYSVISSLVHMHCNRLLDSMDKEEVVIATVRHTLHALSYYKNKRPLSE